MIDAAHLDAARLEKAKRLAEALEKALAFKGRTNGREKIIEYGVTNEMVAKRIVSIYKQVLKGSAG